MGPTERTGGRRVELYARGDLPRPADRRRTAVVDRLRVLADDERIAGFDEFTWEKRIRTSGPTDREARDLYLAFSQWADEAGVGLRPFFDTRDCYSMETGEFGEWLVFPALCLAVYEDGDLAAVYPHADGGEFRSVTDCLDLLAGGGRGPTDLEPEAATPAD